MKFLLFCSLTAASLHAASFIQVTCGSPTGVATRYSETSTSSTCDARDPGAASPFDRGGSSATGSVTLQVAADPSQFSNLLTSQNAIAYQTSQITTPGAVYGPGSSASIAINYSTTLRTAGSIRSGYLQIGPNSIGNPDNYYDGISTMITGFAISPVPLSNNNPNTTVLSCSSQPPIYGCDPGSNYWLNVRGLIPVTLGTNLGLFARGSTTDYAYMFDGLSGGHLNTSFQFRFFEADGVTPVAASEVPEPASLALFLCGFALTRTAWKRRKAGTEPAL